MCPACRRPVAGCTCAAAAGAARGGDGVVRVGDAVVRVGDGVVRVGRESKGRGGKTVTLIRGLDLPAEALAALGKAFRSTCGTGGTLKGGVLELQGDHCDRVMALLKAQGWTVKRVGG